MEKKKKYEIRYKKCPHCKGKGKMRVDVLGLTKEEIEQEVELCVKMADRSVVTKKNGEIVYVYSDGHEEKFGKGSTYKGKEKVRTYGKGPM